MANPYYAPSGTPATSAQGSSSDIRSEFALIETGLDKLPALTADFIVKVNAGGTSLEAVASLGVGQGGTGATTLTDGGILLGSGTSAITALAVLADGEMIVGDGTTDPAIESGATLRTSIGLGTANDPTFNDLTVNTITITSSSGLTFDGSLSETEDTSDTNTRLGINAGIAFVAGGIHNTAFGNDALLTITTNDNCTAVGFDALKLNTGAKNTAVGSGALDNCTSGIENVGVGYLAADFLSTGSSCVSIGMFSNASVTSGNDNTAVGRSANTTGSTGARNTCIGSQTNVSGTGAVGQIALGTNVTADQDHQVVIGSASGNIKNEFDTDAVWSQSSDLRRKTNVLNAVLGLDFINALRPVTYNLRPASELPDEWFKNHKETDPRLKRFNNPAAEKADMPINTTKTLNSLIAQEVLAAVISAGVDPSTFPGWGADDKGQRISKEAMILPLIKAVQELTARVITLETI